MVAYLDLSATYDWMLHIFWLRNQTQNQARTQMDFERSQNVIAKTESPLSKKCF